MWFAVGAGVAAVAAIGAYVLSDDSSGPNHAPGVKETDAKREEKAINERDVGNGIGRPSVQMPSVTFEMQSVN